MYNYCFCVDCIGSYWDHPSISKLYLTHDKKFNAEDLDKMYEEALKKCIERKVIYPYSIGEELIKNYGFKHIEIECRIQKELDGNANINW